MKALFLFAYVCTGELLLDEFPQPIVVEQLALYKIYAPRSERIARELLRRAREIDPLAKRWAEEMGGNPSPLVLGNLKKKAAYQIYREVLLDAGVEDPTTIYELFESILEEKATCQRKLLIEKKTE